MDDWALGEMRRHKWHWKSNDISSGVREISGGVWNERLWRNCWGLQWYNKRSWQLVDDWALGEMRRHKWHWKSNDISSGVREISGGVWNERLWRNCWGLQWYNKRSWQLVDDWALGEMRRHKWHWKSNDISSGVREISGGVWNERLWRNCWGLQWYNKSSWQLVGDWVLGEMCRHKWHSRSKIELNYWIIYAIVILRLVRIDDLGYIDVLLTLSSYKLDIWLLVDATPLCFIINFLMSPQTFAAW